MRGHLFAIAWRNLRRNRRRTWLTAGGIAFAVWMLIFARSMQDGTFIVMIDNAAGKRITIAKSIAGTSFYHQQFGCSVVLT